MEELIDVLDCDGNKTGIIKTKSEIKKDGDFHRAISVCIVNDKKEILIQKRSRNKMAYPNLWSIFVKGHVMAGEDVSEACKREIFEELGVLINLDELQYLYTIKEEKNVSEDYIERIFFDTYLLSKNIDIENVKIQEEEVEDAKWLFYKDIQNLILEGREMVPNVGDYERIFQYIETLDKCQV